MPAGKSEKRVMSQEEKLRAIQRVHGGESKASVARCIGVPESTLRGWCKGEEKIKNDYNNSVSKVNRSIKYEPSKLKKPKSHHSLQPYNINNRLNGSVSGAPVSPSDLSLNLSTAELNQIERQKMEELEKLLHITPATAAVFRANLAQNQFHNQVGDSGDTGNSLAAFPLGAIAPKIGLDQLTPENIYGSMSSPSSLLSANLSSLQQQFFKLTNLTNMLANNGNVAASSYNTTPVQSSCYKSSKPKRISPNGSFSKTPKKSPYPPTGLLMPTVFPSDLTSPKSMKIEPVTTTPEAPPVYTNTSSSGVLMPLKALSIDCESSATKCLPIQSSPSPSASTTLPNSDAATIGSSDILYSRLTNSTPTDDCVAEDLSISNSKDLSVSKDVKLEPSATVLNDNNDDNIDEDRENTMSRNEGLHHGQQFLDWLSTCQDEPQITQQNVDYVANMLTKLQNYKKPNSFIKRRRK